MNNGCNSLRVAKKMMALMLKKNKYIRTYWVERKLINIKYTKRGLADYT